MISEGKYHDVPSNHKRFPWNSRSPFSSSNFRQNLGERLLVAEVGAAERNWTRPLFCSTQVLVTGHPIFSETRGGEFKVWLVCFHSQSHYITPNSLSDRGQSSPYIRPYSAPNMLILEQQGWGKHLILASDFFSFLTKLMITRRKMSTGRAVPKIGQSLLVIKAPQTSLNSLLAQLLKKNNHNQ